MAERLRSFATTLAAREFAQHLAVARDLQIPTAAGAAGPCCMSCILKFLVDTAADDDYVEVIVVGGLVDKASPAKAVAFVTGAGDLVATSAVVAASADGSVVAVDVS